MNNESGKHILLKRIFSILAIIITQSICITAQDINALYEVIDSTKFNGAKEIMVKFSNNTVELYTLPKAYNIGQIIANKGQLIKKENELIYQIDTSWVFSSNFVRLTNLNVNCGPKIIMDFNSDSTVLNLKIIKEPEEFENAALENSGIKFRFLTQGIADYEELNLKKVEYFENEFDWNCHSFKDWKRHLSIAKTTNCLNKIE